LNTYQICNIFNLYHKNCPYHINKYNVPTIIDNVMEIVNGTHGISRDDRRTTRRSRDDDDERDYERNYEQNYERDYRPSSSKRGRPQIKQ